MPTTPPVLRDFALLIGRLGLGIVLIAHGWQKVTGEGGITGVAQGFEGMGVPLPSLSAYISTLVELLGGAALILGLTVPVVGVLVALNMAGAFAFVHAGNGVFVDAGGFELVLVIGVGALMLAALGSGIFGVDHLFADKKKRRSQAKNGE